MRLGVHSSDLLVVWLSGRLVSKRLVIWSSGWLDVCSSVQQFGCIGGWVLIRLIFWSSGRLVAWFSKRLVVWSSGWLDVCLSMVR